MKSLSVCVVFFLVLFTISGDCRVTVNEDRNSREIHWHCIPSTCDKLCKAQEGDNVEGYCDAEQPKGCFCEDQEGNTSSWHCVPATCDQLCKTQQGTAATCLCKDLVGCVCETNAAGRRSVDEGRASGV